MSLTPRTSYEFEFGLPSGDGEGGIEVLNVEGDVIGTVAPPWAVDANGDSVPTAYKLRDNILARTVEHAGAVYPVVADPSVTLGWRIYVWFDVPDDVSRSDYWLALLHGAGGAIGCGGATWLSGGTAGWICVGYYVYWSIAGAHTLNNVIDRLPPLPTSD